MRLYTCEACINGQHEKCELITRVEPGRWGGSKCKCPCEGNPNFNDPKEIHESLMKLLEKIP